MSGTNVPGRCLAWLRRRSGLDTNPVRRSIDRTEAWLRLGLALLFLAGAPALGIGLSHWTATSLTSQASAQAAGEYMTPATLLTDPQRPNRYPDLGTSYGWAKASWTAPDGTHRVGEVDTRTSARKGTVISVWIDAAGRQIPPPRTHAQIVSRMITVGLLAPLGLGLLLLTTAGVAHRLLDRRRMTGWEADWTLVEPHWTRRLS